MFMIIPAIDGVPQIKAGHIFEARSVTPAKAVTYVDTEVAPDWIELSILEYLAYWQAGQLFVDKTTIKTDNLDTATVTVEVHPDLTEITFYHADTNEPIATLPVDPEAHTATLQVTATTPGVIRIRAGDPTVTRLNEVVITAQ